MNTHENYILRLNAKSKAEALQAIDLLKRHIQQIDGKDANMLKVRIQPWNEANSVMELVED